jgi:hypothetical protein
MKQEIIDVLLHAKKVGIGTTTESENIALEGFPYGRIKLILQNMTDFIEMNSKFSI